MAESAAAMNDEDHIRNVTGNTVTLTLDDIIGKDIDINDDDASKAEGDSEGLNNRFPFSPIMPATLEMLSNLDFSSDENEALATYVSAVAVSVLHLQGEPTGFCLLLTRYRTFLTLELNAYIDNWLPGELRSHSDTEEVVHFSYPFYNNTIFGETLVRFLEHPTVFDLRQLHELSDTFYAMELHELVAHLNQLVLCINSLQRRQYNNFDDCGILIVILTDLLSVIQSEVREQDSLVSATSSALHRDNPDGDAELTAERRKLHLVNSLNLRKQYVDYVKTALIHLLHHPKHVNDFCSLIDADRDCPTSSPICRDFYKLFDYLEKPVDVFHVLFEPYYKCVKETLLSSAPSSQFFTFTRDYVLHMNTQQRTELLHIALRAICNDRITSNTATVETAKIISLILLSFQKDGATSAKAVIGQLHEELIHGLLTMTKWCSDDDEFFNLYYLIIQVSPVYTCYLTEVQFHSLVQRLLHLCTGGEENRESMTKLSELACSLIQHSSTCRRFMETYLCAEKLELTKRFLVSLLPAVTNCLHWRMLNDTASARIVSRVRKLYWSLCCEIILSDADVKQAKCSTRLLDILLKLGSLETHEIGSVQSFMECLQVVILQPESVRTNHLHTFHSLHSHLLRCESATDEGDTEVAMETNAADVENAEVAMETNTLAPRKERMVAGWVLTYMKCIGNILSGRKTKNRKSDVVDDDDDSDDADDDDILDLAINNFQLLSKQFAEVTSDEICSHWKTFVRTCLKNGYENPAVLRLLSSLCYGVYNQGDATHVQLSAVDMHSLVTNHSAFMHLMKDTSETKSHVKTALVTLLTALTTVEPACCQSSFFTILLSAYTATLRKTDQLLVRLMRLYEKAGCNLRNYMPFVWGTAAVEHYSTKRVQQPSLLTRISMDDVLDLLDAQKLLDSAVKFPLRRRLLEESDHDDDGFSEDLYDPGFFLPLFSNLLEPGAVVNCRKFAESNALGFTMAALSSEDGRTRAAAYHALTAYSHHTEGAQFPEKQQITYLLTCMKNGVSTSNERVPPIIGVFVAKVAQLMFHPEDIMYPVLNSFLLLRPSLDMYNVPEFYKLFFSSSYQHKQEREWMFTLLAEGLRIRLDFRLAEKRHVFKLLFSYMDSSIADKKCQALAWRMLKNAIEIKAVVLYLVCEHGLLTFLHGLAAKSTSVERLLCIVDVLHRIAQHDRIRANPYTCSEMAQVLLNFISILDRSGIDESIWNVYLKTLSLIFKKQNKVVSAHEKTSHRQVAPSYQQLLALLRLQYKVFCQPELGLILNRLDLEHNVLDNAVSDGKGKSGIIEECNRILIHVTLSWNPLAEMRTTAERSSCASTTVNEILNLMESSELTSETSLNENSVPSSKQITMQNLVVVLEWCLLCVSKRSSKSEHVTMITELLNWTNKLLADCERKDLLKNLVTEIWKNSEIPQMLLQLYSSVCARSAIGLTLTKTEVDPSKFGWNNFCTFYTCIVKQLLKHDCTTSYETNVHNLMKTVSLQCENTKTIEHPDEHTKTIDHPGEQTPL